MATLNAGPASLRSDHDQVAALVWGQHLAGYLRIGAAPAHQERAGPLWRRRWKNDAVLVQLRLVHEDTVRSSLLSSANLDDQLACWARDQHQVDGETYALRWLNSTTADRVVAAWFDTGESS